MTSDSARCSPEARLPRVLRRDRYGDQMLRESDLDPITRTFVAIALERRIRPLCWHIEHATTGPVATGYVTVSLLHEAPTIRRTWADELGLRASDEGSYTGVVDGVRVHLPNTVDPDERCVVCGEPFDPRDPRPDGRKPFQDGDTCRACVARPAKTRHTDRVDNPTESTDCSM